MSQTPRTDARIKELDIDNEDSCCGIFVKINGKNYFGDLIDVDFAKELEIELNEVKETLNVAREAMSKSLDKIQELEKYKA